MKLACFYILKKRLNYCDFISYRRYLVLHELKSILTQNRLYF